MGSQKAAQPVRASVCSRGMQDSTWGEPKGTRVKRCQVVIGTE